MSKWTPADIPSLHGRLEKLADLMFARVGTAQRIRKPSTSEQRGSPWIRPHESSDQRSGAGEASGREDHGSIHVP